MKTLSPEDRLVIARTRKITLANDKLASAFVSRADTLRDCDEMTELTLGIWERSLLQTWSVGMATLEIADGRGLGRRVYDASVREIHAEIEKRKTE